MLHKKTLFLHSENDIWFFCVKKMKTFFGNIVLHSKIHVCAQYEIIWTNYVTVIAITLVIWAESHESSYMRGHFCEHFFKISSVFQVCYFSSKLGHIWWHLAKDSPLWIFLNSMRRFQNTVKTGGLDRSYLGVEFCETLGVSLMKHLLVYLEMSFSKNQIIKHL